MALTEKQKNNIHNLDSEETIEILYECIERLGVVSQVEYMKITAYPYSRQSLVNDMKTGKVKNVKIGGRRLPYIND